MFGARRVYIRIQKGNKVQVRVGGGYMHIDEFINKYTNNEYDKTQKKTAALQQRF